MIIDLAQHEEERQRLIFDFINAEGGKVRTSILGNPNCPPFILRRFENDSEYIVGKSQEAYDIGLALLKNPNISPGWLERFFHLHESRRDSVMSNKSVPTNLIEEVFQIAKRGGALTAAEEFMCSALASNESIDQEMLQFLKKSPNRHIRTGAALNKKLDGKDLVDIIQSEFIKSDCALDSVSNAFANPNLNRDDIIANGFLEDERRLIRISVANNPNLTEEDLLNLLGDLSFVRDMSEYQYHMATSRDERIMRAEDVAINPGATEGVHRTIINCFKPFIGTSNSPYICYYARDETNAIPAPIAEELITQYGELGVLSRTGTPGKVLMKYATSGKHYTRSLAWRNPMLPGLMFTEPEKNEYINRVVDEKRSN